MREILRTKTRRNGVSRKLLTPPPLALPRNCLEIAKRIGSLPIVGVVFHLVEQKIMVKRKAVPLEQLLEESPESLFTAVEGDQPLPCALICAAYVEQALVTLLSENFIEDSDTVKKLFDRGILGDFSSCAKLAYCLGLISLEAFQNACTIAEIRNSFAHSRMAMELDFDTQEIKEQCLKLQLVQWPKSGLEKFDELNEKLDSAFQAKSARDRFTTATLRLLLVIFLAIKDRRRRKSKVD